MGRGRWLSGWIDRYSVGWKTVLFLYITNYCNHGDFWQQKPVIFQSVQNEVYSHCHWDQFKELEGPHILFSGQSHDNSVCHWGCTIFSSVCVSTSYTHSCACLWGYLNNQGQFPISRNSVTSTTHIFLITFLDSRNSDLIFLCGYCPVLHSKCENSL